MVQLIPMSETEYQAYLESDIQRYAEVCIQASHWHPSEAQEKSRNEHEQLLPDGLATKNMYFFSIEDTVTGSKVGILWFRVDDQRVEPLAFVFDFVIHEEFRRRGYATQALRALEEKVEELGIHQISLHVFQHNRAAQALYQKLGYEITGLYMKKRVG